MKPKLRLIKGGPGSGGSRPGAGRPAGSGSGLPNLVPRPSAPQSTPQRPRSGVRPSVLFPYGRNPDGTPRTINDVRDPKKPIGRTDKPNKPKR